MFSMQKDKLLFKQIEQWIKEEEFNKVKFILKHTLPTDLVGIDNVTLLHLAAKHGNTYIMRYLNDRGVIEIDARDCYNATPLMLAINNKHWSAAKFLLEHNADIFATDDDGDSALSSIMKQRDLNPEVFKMFVDRVKSKNPNQIDFVSVLGKVGCTVDKIIYLHDAEITKIFLDWSTFAGTVTSSVEYNSVYVAMITMDEENMKVLLHRGQVDRTRIDFLNCLRDALTYSLYEYESLVDILRMSIEQLVKWKLLSNASVGIMESIISKEPEYRLRLTLTDRLVSYIKEDFGFDIRVHMFGNKNSCILAMVKNGEADINALGRKGRTALHIATACGAIDTMNYLLDCGMSPNIRDENGKTPIFKVFGNKRCLTLLLLYGADLQACDNLGKTFLDFYKLSTFYRDILAIVPAHLAILESNGVSLTEPFRNHIVTKELLNYFQSCCQQLEKMKTHIVHNSLTLFEVLAESMENLTRRVRSLDHETIETFFNSSNVQEYDSYYISASRERLEKAVTISNLRNRAMAVIGDSVTILKPYDLILNKICGYLTYYNLSSFVET